VAVFANPDLAFSVRMTRVVFVGDALAENGELPRSATARELIIDPAGTLSYAPAHFTFRFYRLGHF